MRKQKILGGVVSVVAMLLVLLGGVAAQDASQRELVPGISVDSELGTAQLAQVFTYAGTAGESVKLTIISPDGLALGLVMTDSAGGAVAQGQDERANGFLVVDDVTLEADDTYYVTIFPLAVADVPTEGTFSISLALSGPSDAVQATPAPDVEGDTTEEPTAEPTAVVTEAPAPASTTFTPPQEVLTTVGLQVSLTWNATADFNLEVRDPLGGSVFWDNTAVESGGVFTGFNANGACETFTADAPTETVQWTPGAVPTGSYELLVFYVQDCESNGAVPFTVDVTFDGQPIDSLAGTALAGQVWMASFTVRPDGTVTVGESGVNQDLLPDTFDQIQATASPLTLGESVTSAIVNSKPYDAYTFNATSGDIVSVSLDSQSGNLDAYLFLLDEAGNLINSNDDANADTRNAAMNSQLIEADGQYTIVATRYGQRVGGTEGDYLLNVTSAAAGEGLSQALLGVDVPEGIIEVLLVWESAADLQLLVRDPVGDAVFDDSPIIASGGQLAANGNVGCVQAEDNPYSYTYWPVGQRVRPGTYEIDVWFQSACDDFTPVNATLLVTINGNVVVSDTFTPLLNEHYITTFSIGLDGQVVRGPGGIAGGSETIDYFEELVSAPVLTNNVPIVGTISDDNRFDVYTFDGTAGELVTLRMDATAGTLDTLLFVIGPDGIELVANDDAIPNETTNSAIVDFTLPQTGQYVILATHYGTIYGGTNGTYSLVFSRLN